MEKRYGVWAGNPKGVPEDITRCYEEVYVELSHLFRQCLRKRGYGKDGLYCQQHAKLHPVE